MAVKKNKKNILAIAAHPDDLDFTSAGTLAGFAEEGTEIFYLIISDGSKGSHKINAGERKLAEIRKKEQISAAEVVGAKEVFFLGKKDGEIENTKELRKELVKKIREIKPNIVMSFDPAGFDFSNPRSHRDHRMAAETAFDALYPAAGNKSFFPELLTQGYLPHTPDEIWFFATAKPNKVIDITKTLQKKTEALSSHKSQIENKDELVKKIKEWAKTTALKEKFKYGEQFRVIKL